MSDNALVVFILLIIVFLVITFLQLKRVKHYKKLSETDLLTGLPNYQSFYMELEKQIHNQSHFSLAIIDIDHFRTYNNQSYKLGDEVLKEFCLKLREFLPDFASLARFRMGDEFVILFDDTSVEKAQEIIASVKWTFASHRFDCLKDFENACVSFSEGLTQHSQNISNAEVLLVEAEKLLKLQKQFLVQNRISE